MCLPYGSCFCKGSFLDKGNENEVISMIRVAIGKYDVNGL